MRRNHGDERQVEGVEGARRLPQRGGGSDGDEAWKNRVRLNCDVIQLDRNYIALVNARAWYIPHSHFVDRALKLEEERRDRPMRRSVSLRGEEKNISISQPSTSPSSSSFLPQRIVTVKSLAVPLDPPTPPMSSSITHTQMAFFAYPNRRFLLPKVLCLS